MAKKAPSEGIKKKEVSWRELREQSRKKFLESMRTELIARLSAFLGRIEPDVPDMHGDMIDQASSLADVPESEIVHKEVDEIRKALHRAEEGSYGICLECACEINRERLKALPTATTCVGCQKSSEKNSGEV